MKKLSTTSREDNIQLEPVLNVPSNSNKLGKMKSIKMLNKRSELHGSIDEFLDKERSKFNESCSNDYYLNTIVLAEVMQNAERYFVYGSNSEREAMKEEAVNMLMRRFFDENDDVLNRFKEIISKKVSKYGLIRRCCVRLYNRFLKRKIVQ
jgi:hypothetical protein